MYCVSYPCHSVLAPPSPPIPPIPCGIPQRSALLLLVDTVSMDVRGWKTWLRETDWERMIRGAVKDLGWGNEGGGGVGEIKNV